MKLTYAQAKAHEHASELLTQPLLTDEERCFVLEHWRAGARHINSLAGAYFTPSGLARDLACEVGAGSIIDLCAGIGTLTFHARRWAQPDQRIICVEINPDHVAVGQKILPYATWMCCDIFDLPDVGHFSCALSNPPFGRTSRSGRSPRYQGKRFEYHVIDIASDLADYGVFLIPQESTPFRYSGKPEFSQVPEDRIPDYREFRRRSHIEFEMNCGFDTSQYLDDWNGVAPTTEIVITDFNAARDRRVVGMTAELFTRTA
jgi:hypothetical protein